MRDDLEIIARQAAKRLEGYEEDGGSLYDFQRLAEFVLRASLPELFARDAARADVAAAIAAERAASKEQGT